MEEDGWTDGPAARAEQLQCSEEVEIEDVELRSLISARDASGTLDTHVALITALRARGLTSALQQARQVAAASHPLPPAMYRQWIIDEAQARGMSDDNGELLHLCEEALADFQDVPIWETYLQICTGTSPCENGESEDEDSDADSDNEAEDDEESRALFERAIAAMGTHYSLGHRLFKQYREFERSRPNREKGGSGDKVVALYRRQSGTPTKFAEEAMEVLKGCDPAAASQAEASHQAVLKLRRKVEAYEAKVASQAAAIAQASDEDRPRASSFLAETWIAYAAWAQEQAEIPLALCIFERAVASSRSSPSVWTAYLKLASSLKDHSLEGAIAARAARNCPRVLAFYEAQMIAQEKKGGSAEEMDAMKESALGVAALSPSDHCQIFLAHAAFCRRRLSVSWEQATPAQEEVVTWVQHLRASLGFALAFMEATSSDQSRLPLFHFYAAVEEDLIGDISGAAVSAEARAVWEACVSAYPEDPSSWQLFAAFEHRCGEPTTERAVYRRALNAVPRESLSSSWANLCEEWLLMERLRGSRSDFEDASRWVTSARAELHEKQAAQERRAQREADSKKATPKTPKEAAEPALVRPAKKRAVDTNDAGAPPTVAAKRTRVEATAPPSAPAPASAAAPAEESAVEGPRGIFVSNLPFDVTDESIREVFAASVEHIVNVARRTNKAGRFRGMATVEFGSHAEALRVLSSLGASASLGDRSLLLSLETQQKAPAKPKQKKAESGGVPCHPTTVFVAGLDKSVTDQGLEALFAGCGSVTVARVLLVKGTRESRGEGLVQFDDPESVPLALSTTKDGLTVERSRFPAALPESKKAAPSTNPYMSGQAPKKEVTTETPSGPSKFSFIPRAVR